jgi:hypothetical protein
VGLNKTQKETEQRINLVGMDGTTFSSVTIPALPKRTWLNGLVFVADKGNYLAIGFRHEPLLSHLMDKMFDISFSEDEKTILVVGRVADHAPMAKIELSSYPRSLSCSPGSGNPAFAFIVYDRLKVVRLLSL